MNKFYKILSLIVSLLIVYFLVVQIELGDIRTVLTQIKIEYLLVAFGLYFSLTWFRAHRFYLLLRKKISVGGLFKITLAHALINNILPARTGELSYVYYIRKSGAVSTGNNIASLFVARIFDTLAVVGLMLFSLIFVSGNVSGVSGVITLSFIGFGLLLVLFISLIIWESKAIWLLSFLFSILKLNRFSLGNKILLKAQEAISFVGQLRKPELFWPTCVLTVLIWLVNALMFLLLALGFGLYMDFWQALFIGGLPALASIVPFYTIGNFGLFEGSTTLGLVILGINRGIAISFSFVYHIANILITLIPGIIAYFALKRKSAI